MGLIEGLADTDSLVVRSSLWVRDVVADFVRDSDVVRCALNDRVLWRVSDNEGSEVNDLLIVGPIDNDAVTVISFVAVDDELALFDGLFDSVVERVSDFDVVV